MSPSASPLDWVHLLFNGQETDHGAAGNFTMVIVLDDNDQGVNTLLGAINYAPANALALRLCGKSSSKMISKVTYAYPAHPQDNEFFTYTYQTDSQGFVTKVTCYNMGGGLVETTTVTYK